MFWKVQASRYKVIFTLVQTPDSKLITGGLRSHLVVNRHLSNLTSTPNSGVPSYNVVFIGSDQFSLPSLVALTRLLSPENVSVVVSNENNAVGKCARKQQNKIYLWNDFKANDFQEKFCSEGFKFDFGVVASFGHLIPARIINRFPLGILNVHASLLPRWRGASPIAHSIISGDTRTGVSIMKIAPHKFDVGPVLFKKTIPLDDHIHAPELLLKLAELGALAIIEVIKDLPKFLRNPIEQDDNLQTHAPKLTPEMGEVDWSNLTALEIYRLYRGLSGTFKLKSSFRDKNVDLDDINLPVVFNPSSPYMDSFDNNNCNGLSKSSQEIININADKLPVDGTAGQIVYHDNMLFIRCANSSGNPTWLVVKKVKIGVKWMTANDFKNGYLSKGKSQKGSFQIFYMSKQKIQKHKCKVIIK